MRGRKIAHDRYWRFDWRAPNLPQEREAALRRGGRSEGGINIINVQHDPDRNRPESGRFLGGAVTQARAREGKGKGKGKGEGKGRHRAEQDHLRAMMASFSIVLVKELREGDSGKPRVMKFSNRLREATDKSRTMRPFSTFMSEQ